jgi:hypothetical protein
MRAARSQARGGYGDGFSRPMIETMVGIFVAELTPLAIQAEISGSTAFPSDLGPAWASEADRNQE